MHNIAEWLERRLVAGGNEMLLFLTKRNRHSKGWVNAIRNALWKRLDGPVVPFGAHMEYLSISDQDKSKTHKYGDKRSLAILWAITQTHEVLGVVTYSWQIGRR